MLFRVLVLKQPWNLLARYFRPLIIPWLHLLSIWWHSEVPNSSDAFHGLIQSVIGTLTATFVGQHWKIFKKYYHKYYDTTFVFPSPLSSITTIWTSLVIYVKKFLLILLGVTLFASTVNRCFSRAVGLWYTSISTDVAIFFCSQFHFYVYFNHYMNGRRYRVNAQEGFSTQIHIFSIERRKCMTTGIVQTAQGSWFISNFCTSDQMVIGVI